MKTIYDLIESRRTVHSYKPEAIEPGILEKVIRAGHFAPNHKRTWPWRFTLVGPNKRKELADIAVALKQAKHELSEVKVQKIISKMTHPGGLVVVSQVKSEDSFRAKEDYASIACAIQNIYLAAHSESLGAKWSTGAVTRDKRTYEALRINSDEEEIVGFVWIGVPDTIPAVKRPEFETVFRRLQ